MSWAPAACLLALAGCSPELVSVEISASGARAQLFFYIEQEKVVDVVAAAVPDGQASQAIPRRPGATVVAVDYSCGLEDLGLTAGHVALDPAGVPLRRGLGLRSGRGDRMAPESWAKVTDPPPWMAGLRLSGTPVDPCVRYAYSDTALAYRIYGDAMVGLGKPRLVARGPQGFERYDPRTGARIDTLPLPAQGPRAIFGGGTLTDGAGKGYFFSGLGDGFTVDEAGVVAYLPATNDSTIARSASREAAVAGPPTGDVLRDLYLTTDRGRFDHFDGSRWTAILPPAKATVGLASSAVWLGPGEALLTAGTRFTEILHVQGGSATFERVLSASETVRVVGVVPIPPLNTVGVITDDGSLLIRGADGQYQRSAASRINDFPGRVWAFYAGGHTMVIAHGGHIYQDVLHPATRTGISNFDLELGACLETEANQAFTQVNTIYPLGGGDLLVVGVYDGGTEPPSTHLVLAQRISGPRRCDGTPDTE
ncbi:MAG: hypothetical protein U1E65_19915 [Myxococcota bacterium]